MKTIRTKIKKQMKKVNSIALTTVMMICFVFPMSAFSQTRNSIWLGSRTETTSNLSYQLGQLNANLTQNTEPDSDQVCQFQQMIINTNLSWLWPLFPFEEKCAETSTSTQTQSLSPIYSFSPSGS